MSAQAQLQRARSFNAAIVAPTQPSGANVGSDPHITLSAEVPANGKPTSGFAFFVEGEAETYNLTIWKREPFSGFWAQLLTVPELPPFTWFSVCDVQTCELYFQSVSSADPQEAGLYHLEETGA